MAPLGSARNWIKRNLRSHKNSSSSSRNNGALDPAKRRYSSSASSSSCSPSASPASFSLITSTPSVTSSIAPPVQPGTRIESSVARSTVALQASTSPTSFLQPSHLSSVSSPLSPQSQLHLPIAHCPPPPPARSSSVPLQQPVRATSARSVKESFSSATSKDAISTTYRQAAASRSAPLLQTEAYSTGRQYKPTVIKNPLLLLPPRPPTPSHTQPLVPSPRNNVHDYPPPPLPPHHLEAPWTLHEQLTGQEQNNRSFASLPSQLFSSSPFSFLWSTAQQLERKLGSSRCRTRSTSHTSNPTSCSSSFSRQYQRNPSPIQRSESDLYNIHRNQPPFLATSSLMSNSYPTAAPPPPLEQYQSHFHHNHKQQQNRIYSCQPTNMFRSLSSRFGASTETLPAIETVAQEYARTIKALWRMVEEEELSQRIADAPTEEERERIILEHTKQQQLHQLQLHQHHHCHQQRQEQYQDMSYQHQRSSSSSWLMPSLMQAQFHSSQGSSRQSAVSAATGGSRSSLGTIQQGSQVALIRQIAALKGDSHHSVSKGDPAAALIALQRSRTTNDAPTAARRQGRCHSQQPSKSSCLEHRHHPFSSPSTIATGDSPGPILYQRRSAPQPSRIRFSQMSDATSTCGCRASLPDSSTPSLEPSNGVVMNDSESKLQRSQTNKTSRTLLISSSVQQYAQVLQKQDHMTIEERLLLEEDWRLQAKLLRSADIPLATLHLNGIQKSVERISTATVEHELDKTKAIDPDLATAHHREAFLKEFTEFETAPERQDDEANGDIGSGQDSNSVDDLIIQDPLRPKRTSFARGENEGEEEDEIVVATKVGVRSSRLMQWSAAATTVDGESTP
ncbi:hypothetical protein EMPS_04817 [Entomortierella parvispora]|uniref:Uncharacterized protein n=1 Tax=Entomortierella parvispora TaxID=205924 RepID=A0A9P3LW59_9FUNG|nr:hypothetical protein EMPS_04817 [Entomortierella parvispora]